MYVHLSCTCSSSVSSFVCAGGFTLKVSQPHRLSIRGGSSALRIPCYISRAWLLCVGASVWVIVLEGGRKRGNDSQTVELLCGEKKWEETHQDFQLTRQQKQYKTFIISGSEKRKHTDFVSQCCFYNTSFVQLVWKLCQWLHVAGTLKYHQPIMPKGTSCVYMSRQGHDKELVITNHVHKLGLRMRLWS